MITHLPSFFKKKQQLYGDSILNVGKYQVFSAQADRTLIQAKEQSTIKASIILDGMTLTDPLIRCSPNELISVCREIPVSANKVFWTSNKPAQ
jgi:hypothetical protein